VPASHVEGQARRTKIMAKKTKVYEVSLETPTQGLVFRRPIEASSAKEAREKAVKEDLGYTSDAFARCLKAREVKEDQ
jgi:hypothetical protein